MANPTTTRGRILEAESSLDIAYFEEQTQKIDKAMSRQGTFMSQRSRSRDVFDKEGYAREALAHDIAVTIDTSLRLEAEKIMELGRTMRFEERDEFEDEVLAQLKFRDSEAIAQEWMSHAQSKKAGGVMATKIMTNASVHKWEHAFMRIAGSPGMRLLHQMSGGNSTSAAAGLIAAIEILHTKYGSAGLRVDWALQYILNMLEELQGDDDGQANGWMQAGDGSAELITVMLELAPLIEALKVQYEPFTDRKVYELNEVEHEADEIDVQRLRSFTSRDVSRLMTSEHLYPDDLAALRFGTRTALQRVPMEKTLVPKKGANIKFCLDASGSMFSPFQSKTLKMSFSLWQYGIASAIALIDRAMLHGSNKVALCIFDGLPHPISASGPKQMIQKLLRGPNASGGGTCIHNALNWAIKQEDPELNEEIILISDGEDGVDPKFDLKGNFLTTYFVGSYSNDGLEELSHAYYRPTSDI